MKRLLSMLLAVVMLFTFMTSATVTAIAASASNLITVSKTDFENDEITYTLSVTGGVTKLTGVVIKANFDGALLEVSSAGAAGETDSEGEITPNIPGLYIDGEAHDTENVYSVAYVNITGYTLSEDTEMFTITFRAISEERGFADVEFVCHEFKTEDEVDNEITKDAPQSFYTDSFHALSQPTMVAVDSVDDVLEVQWLPSIGADSYNVYRKDSSSTSWKKINDELVTGISFRDETITNDLEYTYVVSAVNEAGETAYKGSGIAGMNFGAISTVNAVAIGNGIRVTWNELSQADSYDVLRKRVDEEVWTKLTNVTATSYDDKTAASGTEYNYSVRAHSGSYTAGMSCDAPTVKFIAMPKVAVTNTAQGLLLTITEVGGAEEYFVKKSTNDGVAVDLFTVSASDFTEGVYSYTDTNVNGNSKYVYSAYAKAGNVVGWTTLCSAINRLATPTLIGAENTVSGIRVTWEAVADAQKYNLYRKVEGETEFAYFGVTSNTYFDNNSVENGKVYVYTVSAQNSTGSGAFNEAGVSTMRISATTNISAVTTSTGIKVSWNAVSGAQSYDVYRKTASGNYTSVAEDVTATTFVDTTAQKNVEYIYNVKAVVGSYESAYSAKTAAGMDFGTVTSLTYSKIKNGITLKWNALSNAEGYKIYRKTVNDTQFALIKTVTSGNTYNDTSIPSGVVCEYKVEAYNGSCVAQMTANVLSAKYLAVPVVDVKNYGDSLMVSVNKVYGAEYYVIERAIGTSTTYTQLATITNDELQYIDSKNIIEGEKYSYKVRAVAGTIESFEGTDSITKLIAPKITSCANVIAGVQLKWTAIDDAAEYVIYRRCPGDDKWDELATTSGTSFVDASVIPDEVYQYVIEVVTVDGDDACNYDYREIRFLETPDILSLVNSVGGLTVKWSKVDGATGYRVYRRGAGQTSWTYLGTVSASTSSYLDKQGSGSKQIKSGNLYRYTIRAVYDGVDSQGKDYVVYGSYDPNGPHLKYVATPEIYSLYNHSNGLAIKWNKIAGATKYRVYRRAAGQKSWTYIATTSKLYYIDKAVKNANGKFYRYTVRAVSGGTYSSYTNGLQLKRLANPTLKSATSAKAGITVKWSAITGSTGYKVYRKTGNSSWKLIATVKGAKKVSYLDKTAKKGVTYKYTVRAYSGSTLSNYYSGISCKDKY